MSFGEAVKRLRDDRGWKQQELARRAGIRQGYVSALERQKKLNPTQDTLVKLAGAFEISVAELLRLAGVASVTEIDQLQAQEDMPDAFVAELRSAWPDLTNEDRENAIFFVRSLWQRRKAQQVARLHQDQPGATAE